VICDVNVTRHFSFWISLSLIHLLSSEFWVYATSINMSAKKWSHFRLDCEWFAETKLPTEQSLNPKVINSPVDFTCAISFDERKSLHFFANYSKVHRNTATSAMTSASDQSVWAAAIG